MTREKILTVDDDPDILDVLYLTLSEHYDVIQARNGEEGLKIVQQKPPDLIVCDYMMPVMNGREFCKTLKKDILLRHVPVIMLTGKGEIKDRIESVGDVKPLLPLNPVLTYDCKHIIFNLGHEILMTDLWGSSTTPLGEGSLPFVFK